MTGSFSEESLEQFSRLVAEKQGMNFAESGTYDFTRCVRADGSAYGTWGRCRKGRESDLFADDGPGRTGKNYGRIAGGEFHKKKEKNSPTKPNKLSTDAKNKPQKGALGPELDKSLSDVKKISLFKGKEKAKKLIETAERLIKREKNLASKGIVDNAFKGKYAALEEALKKASKRYNIPVTHLLSQLDSLPK